ncbi:MAG: glycosyltransferase family 2 protein [Rhodospirillaceae bacterium]|nr:glycosyltransferase family 2 protein [Rhodospirillaceae bacterium]
MSTAPEVSIIIAAFQAGDFIVDAVRSALAQKFADFEILIAPDEPRAATDYTFLQALDPRVRVLGEVLGPTGAGMARNRALGAARGAFIALLDADDLWAPDYLSHLMPLAERHGAAFGSTRITDWDGKFVRQIAAKDDVIGFADFSSAFGSLHGITRNRADRLWRDVLAEDVLFDLESLALCDGRAPFASAATYVLRLRPTSTTRGDHFITEIGAGYDRLMAMISSDATLIPPPHHAAAITVFRRWQRMNADFGVAAASDPALDFQSFVAKRLLG